MDLDWIDIFEKMDQELKIAVSAHIVTTKENQLQYFKNASKNLTLQYIQLFKKDISYLKESSKPKERILRFIEGMNLPIPSNPKTNIDKSSIEYLFQHTAFEAQNNFYDFIQDYKQKVMNKIEEDNLLQNQTNSNSKEHDVKIFPYCTSEEFKEDLSDLCKNCPIKQNIENRLPSFIKELEDEKELKTKDMFVQSIKQKSNKAFEQMERLKVYERRSPNDGYRKNRINGYVWNREILKLYKKILTNESTEKPINYWVNIENYHNNNSLIEIKNYFKKHFYIGLDYDNQKVNIYNPYIHFILSYKELQIRDNTTEEVKFLEHKETLYLIEKYIKGFQEGQTLFKKEYSVSNDILVDQEKAKKYIEWIKDLYFNTSTNKQSWKFYQNSYSLFITDDVLYTYGLHAGLIHELDELIKKHPSIFKNFYKKKSDTSSNEIIKSTKKEEVIKAFNFTKFHDFGKHKEILTIEDFNKLIEWVTFYFDNNFEIPSINKPIQKVNTAKGNISYTFKNLFKELYPNYDYPTSLFELYKSCFYQYRNDKESNFKKSRKLKNYDDLIKNTK